MDHSYIFLFIKNNTVIDLIEIFLLYLAISRDALDILLKYSD